MLTPFHSCFQVVTEEFVNQLSACVYPPTNMARAPPDFQGHVLVVVERLTQLGELLEQHQVCVFWCRVVRHI